MFNSSLFRGKHGDAPTVSKIYKKLTYWYYFSPQSHPKIVFLKIYIWDLKISSKFFNVYLIPATYSPSPQGPLDTIACAIWALNSQYFVFATQNSVRAKHTPFWGVFCAHTGLGGKSGIMVVQPPYFAGRLVFYYVIGGHTTRRCVSTKKLILSRFSALWNNATIWH